MPHDLLDRAFVSRMRSLDGPTATSVELEQSATPAAFPLAPNPELVSAVHPAPVEPSAGVATLSMVDRLLEASPAGWTAVADAVERAVADLAGSRDGDGRTGFVVAVVSRRPKDGCTTFAEGLSRTLRERGTEAVATTFDRIDRDCGAVQIVDAGSWFGSGPIRRERATTLADACDAAILLRRADRSTAAAFARALAVAGVRVLGEVTNFGREQSATREATE